MVGDTLDDVLETTVGALDLLTLPGVGPETRKLVAEHAAAGSRAVAFTAGGVAHPLELATVVGEGVTVAREVERLGADTLLVGGALTQEFVDDFTRVLPPRTRAARHRARRHRARAAAGHGRPLPAPRHPPPGAHAAARARRSR